MNGIYTSNVGLLFILNPVTGMQKNGTTSSATRRPIPVSPLPSSQPEMPPAASPTKPIPSDYLLDVSSIINVL